MRIPAKIKDFFLPDTKEGLSREPRMDYELLFLQVIGIAAVVLGHYKCLHTAVNDVMTFYSWHMPFFILISGILFARKLDSRGIRQTLLLKIRKLLLPALLVNLCYGIISLVMRKVHLVSYGGALSLNTLLLVPFTTGYQFANDISLWFIFQLFVIEMIFNLLARIPGKKTDIVLTGVALAVSLFCTWYLKQYGWKSGLDLLLLRTGFLSFFFMLGITYEKHIASGLGNLKKPALCAAFVFLLYFILMYFCGIDPYYNTRNMDFSNYPEHLFFLPQVIACFAVFFFILCAKALGPRLENSRFLDFIGNNLKAVVYHHQFVGILLNCTAALLSCIGLGILVPRFNMESFMAKQWYYFAWGRSSFGQVVYFIFPFFVPIVYYRLIKKIRNPRLRPLARLAAFGAVLIYVALVGIIVNRNM